MAAGGNVLIIVEDALALEDKILRTAFVARMCGEDAALRTQVDRLLALSEGPLTQLQTVNINVGIQLEQPAPARIGPFRVICEIARGGMGSVLQAERDDGVFQQTVAIKLIRGDATSPAMRARFAEERRILARLHHPSVVRIIDGGEVDDRLWLAMDFIAGEPIDAALDQRMATLVERTSAFEAVCEALAYAHRQLVIHADIKPSNVLMDAAGEVHLLDFGIARLVADNDAPTAGDAYPLTRAYAAPERKAGEPPTIAGDVFSLGVLMLDIVAQRGKRSAEECLDAAAGGLPPDLHAIAARACAHDPECRYPDVPALIEDLKRLRTHQPVEARGSAGWRYFVGLFIRRHRRGLALSALAGMALLLATAVSTALYVRAEHARAEADARFADAHGTTHYLLFELMPKLEGKPNSLRLRAQIADVAQGYLDRLSNAREASRDVRLEAATGLWRLAQHQSRPGYPHLNQPERAVANLLKAEAIAQSLPGRDARVLLARIRIDQVAVTTSIQTDLPAAEQRSKAMLASIADVQRDAPELELDALAALADLRGWQARFADEQSTASTVLGAIGDPQTRDRSLLKARMFGNEGDGLYYQERATEALQQYRTALATIGIALQRWPDDNFLVLRRSQLEWEVGSTLVELKRYDEAARLLDAALGDASRAFAFDHDDFGARRNIRIIANSKAQLLGLTHHTAQAVDLIRKSIANDRAAMQAQPTNHQLVRDYVFDNVLLGETYDAAGNRTAACASDRAALALYTDLKGRGMGAGYDQSNNLKLLRARLARNCENRFG